MLLCEFFRWLVYGFFSYWCCQEGVAFFGVAAVGDGIRAPRYLDWCVDFDEIAFFHLVGQKPFVLYYCSAFEK